LASELNDKATQVKNPEIELADLTETVKKLKAEKSAVQHENEQLAKKVKNQRQEIVSIEKKVAENDELRKKIEIFAYQLA